MATERSSPGTIYSPLPQSMSDVDSTYDEEEEEELNSVALGNEGGNLPLKTTHIHGVKSVAEGKNGRGRANRGLYQPLGGSDLTLNGIPSQIGLKSKNDCLNDSEMDSSQPPPLILPNTPEKLIMSTSRRACFIFSILLCFLVVIGFLFILPCDLPACVTSNERNTTSAPSDSPISSVPTSTIRSLGGSWERVLPGIELKGRAHLISSPSGPGLNMVFLVRGQLPGLLSVSALPPPSAMSLVSSSFLSESSKCSFAPVLGSRNVSSLNGFDQTTLVTYCNTELEVTLNNTTPQQGWMTSSYLGDEDASQVPEVNMSSSHYRSKRILDNPPSIPSSEITEFMHPDGEHREKIKSAQISIGNDILNSDSNKRNGKSSVGGSVQNSEKVSGTKNHKEKRSSKSGEKSKGDDNGSLFLSALAGGGGGLVSLSGATGQPLWQVPLPSPPEELDCALLDTDNDGIPDCLAFAGRSGLLAAVNPTSGSVMWYLHDHKSQMRPTALQFPVSIPDLDGDGTKDLAIACTLATPSPQPTSHSSNKASSTSPNSSSFSLQTANTKGSSSKSSAASKKDLLYSSSTYVAESSPYQLSRPLPSPSSSPDTVSLAVASGRSGKIIGHPFTPTGCVTVSSITLNMKTLDLFYRCVTEEGDEISKSLSVDDLYGERGQNISFSSVPPMVTPTLESVQESDTSESSSEQESIPSMPLTASSTVNVSPSFSSSPTSHSERHSTSSSAWVSDHRLLVENHGHCHTILLSPISANSSFQNPPCSVSVRLTDSRNSTLWAHEGVLAHAMDPVPLLFRQPNRGLWPEDSPSSSQSSGVSEHPVSGFVLKFWQWSMPKVESSMLSKEDKSRDPAHDKSPGGPNSLFRTRLRRKVSPDLILPPLAAAASSSSSPASTSAIQNHSSQAKRQSPIGNVPRHGGLFPNGSGKKKLKGNSYKGVLPPIVNQLKERVVLITFNDTGLHVINASQSDVTQLCERIRSSGGSGKKRGKGSRPKDKTNQESVMPDQKLRCQPELAFQEQSLLVADLDKDGYQELVSYLTTYVDIQKDESDSRRRGSSSKWFLESRVKVVLLEAELPKLYEAVATPGS